MPIAEELANKLNECAEKRDFEGAFGLVRSNQGELAKQLQGIGVRDALKKTTNDRLLLSFLDGAGFEDRPLDEALVRLEKLLGFQPGAMVLAKTWGLGTVRKVDYFYRRVTVDFKVKRGHQFTYAAAVDMLESAPEDHILVIQAADPARVEKMLKDEPGEFVKAVLRSYGDMTITRLEDVCVQSGFVKAAGWKSFWERARADLRKDKLVDIPVKRTDPISLRASVEDYGDNWLMAFSHETDPKLILAAVREYVAQGKLKTADEETKRKIEERLAFAVTAARKVDDALYARLACAVTELGFATPPACEMRDYLWERKRFVPAAAELPAREVGEFLAFLAVDDQAKERIYKAIPEFCYAAVTEITERFGEDANCRRAVGAFLREPKAPATLVTLVSGKYEKFMSWEELPSLLTVLTHAIALGEGRQSGETLKMQNLVRRLFSDRKWLEKMFSFLPADDRALFFERFQASIAWDHSTHHTIVVRMTKIAPELESRMVKVEKKREYARITSPRSYEERQREYFKLINEEMPANVKRIEFAKSYGDLSENAEYQYAKDEQRVLMQKQTVMQAELDAVKAGDFADATTDEVMPGVEVIVAAKDGDRKYVILGEWDNDLERGIISSQTRVAKNLMGKKVGDKFKLPDAEGSVELASVKEILPLSDDVKAWMKI
ncbi:MAG: GreA/GreB family elongation factor [Kiritimatiellae bacterium]|nr:GreA/GreB family elongation factor [Kiritimatiellia bacterium]